MTMADIMLFDALSCVNEIPELKAIGLLDEYPLCVVGDPSGYMSVFRRFIIPKAHNSGVSFFLMFIISCPSDNEGITIPKFCISENEAFTCQEIVMSCKKNLLFFFFFLVFSFSFFFFFSSFFFFFFFFLVFSVLFSSSSSPSSSSSSSAFSSFFRLLLLLLFILLRLLLFPLSFAYQTSFTSKIKQNILFCQPLSNS